MGKKIAKITGVGGYLPDYVLTNAELETLVETNDEWIKSRTGIEERRILKGEGLGSSVMGTKAVENLLEKTNTPIEEIDLIICATVTPDMFFPSTANLIAHNLGAGNTPSFDIAAACSGFLYGLSIGSQFISAGTYKKVIIVGADKMSSITNYSDRNTCILFGDGSAAVLLEASDDGVCGIHDTAMYSNAMGKDHLYLKGGGSAYPASAETLANKDHYFIQHGKSVFKVAVVKMAEIVEQMMNDNNLKSEDITWLVPHQANKRIIDATARRMGISMEKVMVNIQRYGNTTAATIPLCLWDWEKQLKKGDNLILAAFGGGYTWGGAYVKWAYDSE